ncbi:hypothetical protein SmJEL517_g03091 [Synchytrium microbalum]|uniref:Mini-chromosome maintenance complex-binding protein n=1 Tax=Synchytrium microbalum TaxID=1806994 RepID=A0A507BXW3_9FUNG|nr:uncharacterized protein SmJEL517_g03091 [Synchytrium microbalum]TPX34160.1 hypothetical protein SmJEL517_g03091 [Synchytrium microbalum]
MEEISSIIRQPLRIIQELLAKEPNITAEAISNHFEKLLQDPDLLHQIPSFIGYGIGQHAPYSLVRFRCMIQDNGLSPQVHLQQMQITNVITKEQTCVNTWFVDEPPLPEGQGWSEVSPFGSYVDKQPYFAVGVPALSAWTQSQSSETEELESKLEGLSLDTPRKTLPDHIAKKISSSVNRQAAAILKVYPSIPDLSDLKLNQVLDVIGIVEYPQPSENMEDSLAFDEDDFSSVPIINALVARKVVDLSCVDDWAAIASQVSSVDATALRNAMIESISTFVLGDRLAAEYLWLYMFSTRLSDQNRLMQPLNLTGYATLTEQTLDIKRLFSLLLPQVSYIPLSLEYLNKQYFASGTNPGATGLSAGELQVADGTLLLLDETRMEAGKLEERGIANLASVENLLRYGMVPYALGTQHIDVAMNVGVVILSNSSCMFSVDVEVPMVASADGPSPSDFSKDLLETARKFIAVYKNEEYSIPEPMELTIQNYFANVRAEEHRNRQPLTGQAELMRLLALARLVTLSVGKTQLMENAWNHAITLEATRKARIQARDTATRDKHVPSR